jgi:lipoate-protein ligase B
MECYLVDLPVSPYTTVWTEQLHLVQARKTRRLAREVVIVGEHLPVFTLGRHATKEHLLVSLDFLKKQGIEVHAIERGGDITYHGPGQIVVYPILDLRHNRLSVKDLVSCLEEAMIQTSSSFGVKAKRDTRNRGVWVREKKIGSIGLALRQGITFHGLAFNVDLCLTPFSWINPCGLSGVSMTSLAAEIGQHVSKQEVRSILQEHLTRLLNMSCIQGGYDLLAKLVNGLGQTNPGRDVIKLTKE